MSVFDIGRTPHGQVYFLIQDVFGEPRAFVADDDEIEELARDLLDRIGRDYCLPYLCDHLDVAGRTS